MPTMLSSQLMLYYVTFVVSYPVCSLLQVKDVIYCKPFSFLVVVTTDVMFCFRYISLFLFSWVCVCLHDVCRL